MNIDLISSHLNLDDLLDLPKHAIDLQDPKAAVASARTTRLIEAMRRIDLCNRWLPKYQQAGDSDTLRESYSQEWLGVRIPYNVAIAHAADNTLNSELTRQGKAVLDLFREFFTENDHGKRIDATLKHNLDDFKEIIQDEATTWTSADDEKFGNYETSGYPHDYFANRTRRYVELLGALRTFSSTRYATESFADSLRQYLINAGYSFQDHMVNLPKNENVYMSGCLKEMNWTPERVHEQAAQLDSLVNLVPVINEALSYAIPAKDEKMDPKVVCCKAENAYNLRKIGNHLKHTLCYLFDQWLDMVRHYR
jgi:hypothetical protein